MLTPWCFATRRGHLIASSVRVSKRRWRWKRFVSLGAAALLIATPASADTYTIADADDSPSALDVASIMQSHERLSSGQLLLSYTIEMYEPWSSETLKEAEVSDISLHFDLNNEHEAAYRALGFCGEGFERILELGVSGDGSLYGELRTPRQKVVGFAKVWRPDDKSVQMSFPKSALKPHLHSYQWCAQTAYHEATEPSSECGESSDVFTLCTDRAPDRRTVRHKL